MYARLKQNARILMLKFIFYLQKSKKSNCNRKDSFFSKKAGYCGSMNKKNYQVVLNKNLAWHSCTLALVV